MTYHTSIMLSDRELLELAAKAAGIKIDKSEYNGGGRGNTGFDILGNAVLDWHNGKTWNPLTNDGDAMRLVVKLNIDVMVRGQPHEPPATAVRFDTDSQRRLAERHKDDPEAATRRAIVLAAAAIAIERAMP